MIHRSLAYGLLLAAVMPTAVVHAQAIAPATVWQGPLAVPAATNPKSLIVSYDNGNELAIQSLIGADRFYSAGVFGQGSVAANVEAGLAWNQHDTLKGITQYIAPGSSGEVDWHATAVTMMIGGYDPNDQLYYYKLGMAPLTDLNSAAIATGWYNSSDPSDPEAYFNVTPQTFYNGYNYYLTQTWQHTVNLGGFSVSQPGPADVISSSWGFTDSTGSDPLTQAADGFARAHSQTTFVLAAGNSNTPTNSTNNVGGPASGYNSISVGAVGDDTYNNYTGVAAFSSRGPQDYYDPVHGTISGVRAPVSLVAPGTTLASAYYGGQTGSNGPTLRGSTVDSTSGATNLYATGLDGTSFATPIVSGGVSLIDSTSYLLLWGGQSRDARVVKAVLMNSADKLSGWDNGQQTNGSGVVVTTQSVDWQQGAGMLDMNKAFDQYISGTTDVSGTGGGAISKLGWDYGSISKDPNPSVTSHNDYPIVDSLHAGDMMDVTLDWFRDLGSPVYTDNADPDLQQLTTSDDGFANLDLEIWNSSFTHLYAESISQYNDVQELHFAIPADGLYGIRVSYAGQMFGTPQAEDYGLAWAVPEPGTAVLSIAILLAVFGGRTVLRRRRGKLMG